MADTSNKENARKSKRSIVLLGRTGVGKATVANQIAGKELFHIGTSLEGVTRQVREDPLPSELVDEGKSTEDDVLYRFKAIDIVGPYGKSIKIDDMASKIKHFATTNEGVNLILFIVRKDALTDEEIQTFKTMRRKFKMAKIKKICALVITGCESLGEKAKQELINDIKTPAIAGFTDKGIYTVGFPRLKDLEEDFIKMYEERMKNDSKILRDLAQQAKLIVLPKDFETESVVDVISKLYA